MALGIGLASVANVGINLGTNIIKLAFNRRQAKVEEYKEALAMIEEDVTEDWSDPTKAAAHTAAPATVAERGATEVDRAKTPFEL